MEGRGWKRDSNLERMKDEDEERSYLPTPPLGQDMTQGQILSGV